MRTKVARWVVSCLMGLLTVSSLASRTKIDLAVGAAPVESSKLGTNWQKKVEPGLLKTLEGGQKSNVLIYFSCEWGQILL